MRFVSQGERIVMLVEPGCVENQEEMETFSCGFRPSTQKEDEEDPLSVSTQPDSGTGGIR